MKWPEVKGLCIGYSSKGTSGSGIGPGLRNRLLFTAQQIIRKGRNDPELFELVGLFEADFGPDRISDMTANVIRVDLAKFTKRVYGELLVEGARPVKIDVQNGMPLNPYTGAPILLVPRSLLRDLPVAFEWSRKDIIAADNEDLRMRLNSLIGSSWREAIKSFSKERFKNILLENPDLIDDLVKVYSEKVASPYNFVEDRAGEYLWFPATQAVTKEFPLSLQPFDPNSVDEVEVMVLTICEKFKSLVEDNGLCDLFYNSDGSHKNESAMQLVFFGVADAYCHANKVMIARESNSGRGPVDFKFGSNQENSVLVEIKKSTNTSGLKKGVTRQLPQYMKSEGSKRAIYLVIDIGYTKSSINSLNQVNKSINGTAIKIFHIDGNPKPSASKL
ncbi:hypothetical protein ACFPPA_09200 [Rhodanobacter ginsengisoli]|uniref:Protein NO VEIN C-terminal domain-containing protein n=2 Tax=Rhodanobacter ginsengisoli TaxID=418646 RepID=A0ABW0QQR4_9GAMM